MKKRSLLLLLILTFFTGALGSGCHSTLIVTDATQQSDVSALLDRTPETEKSQASLGMGIYFLSDPLAVNCKEAKPDVHIEEDLLDNLIHFFVGPFYTTRTVEVICRR